MKSKIDHSFQERLNEKIMREFVDWLNGEEHLAIFNDNQLSLSFSGAELFHTENYDRFYGVKVFAKTPEELFYIDIYVSPQVITDSYDHIKKSIIKRQIIKRYPHTKVKPSSDRL